jgi:hypothetical protein
LLIAMVASVCTLYRPTLLPPGLHHRALQIGTASTVVMVAAPNLAVGGNTYQYEAVVNRSTLFGNEMISPPVLDAVAQAIGVRPGRIQATAPMTANVPRALIDPGSGGSATDIVAQPDQYKLEIQADPSVPILHVYTQAPTPDQAVRFATATVQAATRFLGQLESTQKIPAAQRVTVEQLGAARGGVANPGGPTQMAILVFVGAFCISLWISVILANVRGGWRHARLAAEL